MKNKTLAFSAIALIAVMMVVGSVSPGMATQDDNNGKAKGCENANDKSKAGEQNPHCGVPDVVGLGVNTATSLIVASGYTVGTITEDLGCSGDRLSELVCSQDPPAGTVVDLGSPVNLVIDDV